MVLRQLKHESCSRSYAGGGAWNRPGPGSAYARWIDALAKRLEQRLVVREEPIDLSEIPEEYWEDYEGETETVTEYQRVVRKGVLIVEPDGTPAPHRGGVGRYY